VIQVQRAIRGGRGGLVTVAFAPGISAKQVMERVQIVREWLDILRVRENSTESNRQEDPAQPKSGRPNRRARQKQQEAAVNDEKVANSNQLRAVWMEKQKEAGWAQEQYLTSLNQRKHKQ